MALVYCRSCGAKISDRAVSCPKCGDPQKKTEKNRITAGLLALFLGGIGIHRFYLGQWWGIIYLLLCWTYVPLAISILEAVWFFMTSERDWRAKYGGS